MDKKAYEDIYMLEKDHWWFRGRREIIFDMLRRTIPGMLGVALDVGCGTGFNAQRLKGSVEKVLGLEMSSEMITFSNERAPDIEMICGKFLTVYPRVRLIS